MGASPPPLNPLASLVKYPLPQTRVEYPSRPTYPHGCAPRRPQPVRAPPPARARPQCVSCPDYPVPPPVPRPSPCFWIGAARVWPPLSSWLGPGRCRPTPALALPAAGPPRPRVARAARAPALARACSIETSTQPPPPPHAWAQRRKDPSIFTCLNTPRSTPRPRASQPCPPQQPSPPPPSQPRPPRPTCGLAQRHGATPSPGRRLGRCLPPARPPIRLPQACTHAVCACHRAGLRSGSRCRALALPSPPPPQAPTLLPPRLYACGPSMAAAAPLALRPFGPLLGPVPSLLCGPAGLPAPRPCTGSGDPNPPLSAHCTHALEKGWSRRKCGSRRAPPWPP
jgi:hypothetical protein